jgi:cytoskeletal protein RodZ
MIAVVYFAPRSQELPRVQIANTPGVTQPAPTVAPQATPVPTPLKPAAPIEPAKRVTANREGNRGDLQTQQQQRSPTAAQGRGRLIDMFV